MPDRVPKVLRGIDGAPIHGGRGNQRKAVTEPSNVADQLTLPGTLAFRSTMNRFTSCHSDCDTSSVQLFQSSAASMALSTVFPRRCLVGLGSS